MTFDDIIKQNFSRTTEKYLTFCKQKHECQSCFVFNDYKTVVLSEGNAKNPTFMFVGESAGRQEIEQGRPMIGAAGQLLREHLKMFGFTKGNSIITNVIPCRPLNNVFPKDWDVAKKCFGKWLIREIETLKPKIVITLGAPAMRAVRNKIGVAANRGVWEFVLPRQVYALSTWHPSYVLRCQNDPNKQNVSIEFKNDLKRVATDWKFLYSDNKFKPKEKFQPKENKHNKVIVQEIISPYEEQIFDSFEDLEDGEI